VPFVALPLPPLLPLPPPLLADLVGVGVGDVAALFVASGVGVAELAPDAVELFDLVAGAVAAAAVGVGSVLAVVVVLPVDPLSAPATGAISKPVERFDWFAVSCGGVMARTAPKPPTVPPAIKSARFISLLSPSNL
jgi:hypothetical protein